MQNNLAICESSSEITSSLFSSITGNRNDLWKSLTNKVKTCQLFNIFLSSSGSGSTDNDPIRKMYLDCAKKKRDNAVKRRDKLIAEEKKLRANSIKLKFQAKDNQLENEFQQKLAALKNHQDEIKKQIERQNKISTLIKKGETLPNDILQAEIDNANRTIDNMIKHLPAGEQDEATKRQNTLLKVFYKTEDNNNDDDGNPNAILRSHDEITTFLAENPDIKDEFDRIAKAHRKDLNELISDESKMKEFADEFAKTIGAADPQTIEAECEEASINAIAKQVKLNELKEKIESASKDANDKTEASKAYAKALEEEDKSKKVLDTFESIKNDSDKKKLYAIIAKNKSKEPFKSLLKDTSEVELANTLGDKLKGKTITASEIKTAISNDSDLKAKCPKESSENGAQESIKFEPSDESINDINEKTVDSQFESGKKTAENSYASKVADKNDKKDKLKDVGLTENTAVDNDGAPKTFDPEIPQDVKDALKDEGLPTSPDSVIQSSIEAGINKQKEIQTNANKRLQDAKDAQRYINTQYAKAKQDEQTSKLAEMDSEKHIKAEVEKQSKETKNSLLDGEELDENGVPYIKIGDEIIKRPDSSNIEELENYRKKVAVQAAIAQLETGKGPKEQKVIQKKIVKDGDTEKVEYTDENGTKIDENEVIKRELENKKIAETNSWIKKVLSGEIEVSEEEAKQLDDAYEEMTEDARKKYDEEFGIDFDEKNWSEKDESDEEDDNDKEVKDETPDEEKEENKEESDSDEDGKPNPPKRRIRKKSGKRKGTFKYIYKSNETGKLCRATKKDWEANVRAWRRYKKKLAEYNKTNSNSNSDSKGKDSNNSTQGEKHESITIFLKKNLVLEGLSSVMPMSNYIKFSKD